MECAPSRQDKMTGVKMQTGKLNAIQRYHAMAAVLNNGVRSNLKSVSMNSGEIRKFRCVQLDDIFGGVVVRNLVVAEELHFVNQTVIFVVTDLELLTKTNQFQK